MTNYIQGIDISFHQGKIDWTRVKGEGQNKFAFIRATAGGEVLEPKADSNFVHNFNNAKAAGVSPAPKHLLTTLKGDEFQTK